MPHVSAEVDKNASELEKVIQYEGGQMKGLTFTLKWNARVDLDLYLVSHSGDVIYFLN